MDLSIRKNIYVILKTEALFTATSRPWRRQIKSGEEQ